MSAITEHKKCVCVEFGDTNNNKFWEYTLYNDGTAMTAFGRIGVTRTENFPPPAKALKKWAAKTNPNNKPDKRYTEIKAVDTGSSSSASSSSVKNAALKDVARKQISHKNPLVQDLIDYLVKVNAHQILKQSGGKIIYNSDTAQFKTPLGVIVPDQVAKARDLLVDISDFVRGNDFNNIRFNSTLNSYLRLIPHDVGMTKITPRLIFPNTQTVIAENDLLTGLETSFIDVTTKPTKKKDNAPQVFNVELDIVTDKTVITMVRNLYQSTRKSMHTSNNLSIQTIYKIDIKTARQAFENYGANLSNIKQLWHGSKCSNVLSIFRQGLVIPPSSSGHVTGRMWSDGAYFSDISTKSLNYATNFWGGAGDTSRTFMFLAAVAMGKTYIPRNHSDGPFPKKGYDSTFAKAGISGVYNNEMVVYRVDQCNLVYLVEFIHR